MAKEAFGKESDGQLWMSGEGRGSVHCFLGQGFFVVFFLFEIMMEQILHKNYVISIKVF